MSSTVSALPHKILFTLMLLLVMQSALAVQPTRTDGEANTGKEPYISGVSPWHTPNGLPRTLVKKWDDLSPEEKRKVQEARDRYKDLPKDKKEKLRKKWEDMPEEEKEKYKLERKYR